LAVPTLLHSGEDRHEADGQTAESRERGERDRENQSDGIHI
jgi:hypothetical protein